VVRKDVDREAGGRSALVEAAPVFGPKKGVGARRGIVGGQSGPTGLHRR